jgi:hypothetical protein
MRTPEEIAAAVRHLKGAGHGFAQRGDDVNAGACVAILDFIEWSEGRPSHFADNMRKWDEIDKRSMKVKSN